MVNRKSGPPLARAAYFSTPDAGHDLPFTIHHSPFTIHGMSNTKISRPQARGAAMWVIVVAAFAALSVWAVGARGATWKGLEPLTSKRADVERVLGAPVSDKMAQR